MWRFSFCLAARLFGCWDSASVLFLLRCWAVATVFFLDISSPFHPFPALEWCGEGITWCLEGVALCREGVAWCRESVIWCQEGVAWCRECVAWCQKGVSWFGKGFAWCQKVVAWCPQPCSVINFELLIMRQVLRWKYSYTPLGHKTMQQNFSWNMFNVLKQNY